MSDFTNKHFSVKITDGYLSPPAVYLAAVATTTPSDEQIFVQQDDTLSPSGITWDDLLLKAVTKSLEQRSQANSLNDTSKGFKLLFWPLRGQHGDITWTDPESEGFSYEISGEAADTVGGGIPESVKDITTNLSDIRLAAHAQMDEAPDDDAAQAFRIATSASGLESITIRVMFEALDVPAARCELDFEITAQSKDILVDKRSSELKEHVFEAHRDDV